MSICAVSNGSVLGPVTGVVASQSYSVSEPCRGFCDPVAPTLPSQALGDMEQEPQLAWGSAGLLTEAQKAGPQQPRGPPRVHPQKGRGRGKAQWQTSVSVARCPRRGDGNCTAGLKSQPLCALMVPPWQVPSPQLLRPLL